MHQSYGSELGLTSDDEDYIAPVVEEDKLSVRLSVESFSEVSLSNNRQFQNTFKKNVIVLKNSKKKISNYSCHLN